MNDNKKIGFNAVLNTLRNLLKILFPLITFPYVSRVLGVTGLGAYNYSLSVVGYFSLFAAFGVNSYAVREGGRIKNNKVLLEKFISEMFSINIVTTIISYSVLIICLFQLQALDNYIGLIVILSIQIAFETLGLEWLFVLLADYQYITIRTIIMQIVSILALFVFVKSKEDILIYAIIAVGALSGANIINYLKARKIYNFQFTTNLNWCTHKRGLLIIFINIITASVYCTMDTTFLGYLCGDYSTGLYIMPNRIFDTVKGIIVGGFVVAVPKIVEYIGNNQIDAYTELANTVYKFLVSIIVPSVVGIIMLSQEIVTVIGGQSYAPSGLTLMIISMALFFNIIANFWGQCVLLPFRLEKGLLVSSIFATTVNAVLNFVLIPRFQQNAAALTTVLAELVTCYIQYLYGRKFLKLNITMAEIGKIVCGTILMAILICFANGMIRNIYINLLFVVFISAVFYFFVELFVKNEVVLALVRSIGRRKTNG